MSNLQILLVTEDEEIKNKISKLSTNHILETLGNDELDHIQQETFFDVIIIAEDLAEYFSKVFDNPSQFNIPLIYLFKNQNLDKKSDLHRHISDSLNINTLTTPGLNRALSAIAEKYHMLVELNEQINLLKSLTLSDSELKNSNPLNEFSSIKDLISENKNLISKVQLQNETLKKLASNDMLTDIPNRRNFEETLFRLLAHAKRHEHTLALLFIDLDKFKNVNDTLGHQAGDLLLQTVAKRLKNCLRSGDFVARIGGDEFAIILHEIKSTHAAGIVAWKVISELNKTYNLNGKQANISASIGISCFPKTADSCEELIKKADLAMYQAKKSATQKYIFASLMLQKDHHTRLSIEAELKNALQNNEFSIVYQPIFSIPSKRLHGFESLIRWKNKKLGIIPPDTFIPIADDIGMMHPIGKWVFETVCSQLTQWIKNNYFTYKMAINLSPTQLTEDSLYSLIHNIIDNTHLPYNIFEFEISEVAITEHNNNAMLEKLHKLGTSQSLDDFGIGNTSINELKDLPLNTIKIDKTFVHGMGVEHSDNQIVSSLISLAKSMNFKVVAEGVETKEQLDLLIENKCDYAQGFYFSKPLAATDAEKLMIKESKKTKTKT